MRAREQGAVRRPAVRGLRAGLVRRLDWVLVLAVAGLSLLSLLLVASATAEPGEGGFTTGYFRRHALHLAVGVTVCAAVSMLDYRVPKVYAPLVYGGACLGLLLVFTPLGQTINGSRGWLVFAGLQMQPSELAKVAVIIIVAMLLGEPRDGEHAPTGRDILAALAVVMVPLGLIATQPDLGTALVVGVVFGGLLALSGAPPLWIVGMGAAAACACAAVFLLDLLEPYQMQRLTTLMDPTADPQGAGYNANQALIAVGSGGVEGKGLFQGDQTAGRFVPEQHTDFVFTVAGEELGLLGAGALVVLLAVVVVRILEVARRCRAHYGGLVCAGVAVWFAFQGFVNIGMGLGVMPVTGLPLPFVSYGGTATVAQFAAVGLVLGIHARDRGFD